MAQTLIKAKKRLTTTRPQLRRKPTAAQLRRQFERATKLSQILAIALHDLRLAERSPKFKINMENWWYKNNGTNYEICFAGAVMAGRYPKFRPASCHKTDPSDFQGIDETELKFYALNHLRSGDVRYAAAHLGINVGNYNDPVVRDYDEDRDGWWEDMRQLLKDLRKAGW